MPFVDLVSADDYASLWYWTNTPSNNVSNFDPNKPTLVLLHPACLDSSWMQAQAEDPRLSREYNMIMFDTRITGQSECKFAGKHDLWVTAADLAHAFYHLHLPPAHIFAPDVYTHAALRFAVLFPSLCLSLTLCNVPPPTEAKTVFDSVEELTQLWAYAEDLETFEYTCKEYLALFAGPHAHPDLLDEIVSFWETYYPPFRRVYAMLHTNLMLNRQPLTTKELAAVKVPILIVQAQQSVSHPLSFAQQLVEELNAVSGGATLFPVRATAGYLSVVCSSIVNQVFAKFLSRQSRARSDLVPPEQSLETFTKAALSRLAELKGDPSIAKRDPSSPLSFSCVTPEIESSQEETVSVCSKGMRHAFSPLGPDRRPIRKFSERQDHWLDAGRDGFSRSELSSKSAGFDKSRYKANKSGYQKSGSSTPPTPPLTDEPVSSEVQLARTRRTNVLYNTTVDKQVVKGSMAKVVSATTSSVPRLLR